MIGCVDIVIQCVDIDKNVIENVLEGAGNETDMLLHDQIQSLISTYH